MKTLTCSDYALHKQLKLIAVKEGKSMTQVTEEAIALYVESKIPVDNES